MSNLFSTTYYVCSICHRAVDNDLAVGWLIGTARDPELAAQGVMVIRCPAHITAYAVRITADGRRAIRRR